ncbi:hypothetical protein B5M09_011408 [Aphanomyces astaci]|uniref:U2A'/phosphoprotein 32 family A C-terminal domain-containing protein n=1 Tax=Aphanomyces astaci TaxID=112090 RepID=A0A425CRB9_APHAT|nr:hypothetical protein B5M09_011408 [Aphanomyces astaci]
MIVSTPQEVIVVDEGISDLDDILRQADVAALQHLNISVGDDTATSLELLNVNHNLLQSVDGIETLTALCVLKASHNKLSSLEWVGALSHLSELWISHNKIDLPQLKELKPLTKLHTLLIEANPCCKEPSYK